MKKIFFYLFILYLYAEDTTITIWQNSEVLTIDSQNPTINWEYPNGSEQFNINETINGIWTSDDSSFSEQPIQISISKSIGETYISLTESIENTGNTNLTLPNEDLQFVRIKATAKDIFGNYSIDYSEGYFTIGNPEISGSGDSTLVITQPSNTTILDSKNPSINLSTPNGGESYSLGESISIQWNAEDDQFGQSPINIQQSTGIGSPYTPISGNIENLGNYSYNLPTIDEQFVRLKITATDDFGNNTSDYSEGYFTIGNPIIPGGGDSTFVFSQVSNITMVDSKNPEILLESPNGGELLPVGAEIEVIWSATDDTFLESPITVLFSEAIGQSYEPLTLNETTENDGLESVLLPEIYTENGRFKVKATDQFGNTSSDESDGYVSLVLVGCMDINATNYNPDANWNDNSCTYPDNGDYSLSFDGVDDYVIVQDSNSTFYDKLTIRGKVKPNSVDYDSNNHILSKYETQGNQRSFGIKFQYQDGEYYLRATATNGDDNPNDFCSYKVILEQSFNEWINFHITYDRSAGDLNRWTFMVNGEYLPNIIINDNDITFGQNNTPILIGGIFDTEHFSEPVANFNGIIDEIYLTNDKYNNEQHESEDYLFHYKFNAGSGNILYDHSGNQNHGTIHGATWSYEYDFTDGNNLISLPGSPQNDDSQYLVSTMESLVFILGQGQGLFNTDDGWSGNLTRMNALNGYWVNVGIAQDWSYLLNGEPVDAESNQYDLTDGNNLVSYLGQDDCPTIDALGDGDYNFILGQGQGLFNTADGWSGNLTTLYRGNGYWLNTNGSMENFYWSTDCTGEALAKESTILQEYQVNQSTEQAFYLINEIIIDNQCPKVGDIILAYNNDIHVGSGNYNSELSVLPVMGRDLSEQTIGFIEVGQTPTLKLLKASGELIDLEADLEPFSNLLVSEVASVTGSTIVIPTDYALHPAYPNPFNPITNINYSLPVNDKVILKLYNINGELISTLDNGIKSAGNHTIEWNAEGYPSGVYFVKLDAGDFTQTQKLMLVK